MAKKMNDNTLAIFYFNIILRVDRMSLLNKTDIQLEYIILKVFNELTRVYDEKYWKLRLIKCIYWDDSIVFSF